MSFESFPSGNTEEQSEQVASEESIGVEKNNSAELEAKFQEILKERLKNKNEVVTDDDLASLMEEISQEVGLKEGIFEGEESRPKVFYRVFRNNEAVSKLVSEQESAIRPFSFSMPGTKGEIPLSYGGNDPVVMRIVDTTGEWEDTGKFLKQGGEWNEAMNLNPVVLKKVSEGRVRIPDVHAQVGRENSDEGDVLEVTYIIDKERTRDLRESGSLDGFANDTGFWKEISKRARYFSPTKESESPDLERLNSKYLDYFRATMKVERDLAKDESAREALMTAQESVADFLETVKNLPENDPNWTLEKKQEVLDKLAGILG